MSRNKLIAGIAVVVLVGIGFASAGCGSDSESLSGKDLDGAFVTGMVPHHESAIEMAKVALKRAERPEITELATNIVASQGSEIKQMTAIHERLFGEPVGAMDHGSMGMDYSMMGMDTDLGALETAKPFDREFIDQMIPHHQGAIRMARMELRDGEDQQAKDLATAIVDAQAVEIEQMNDWREKWYGAPSPVGGVPSLDETVPEDESMYGMEH